MYCPMSMARIAWVLVIDLVKLIHFYPALPLKGEGISCGGLPFLWHIAP